MSDFKRNLVKKIALVHPSFILTYYLLFILLDFLYPNANSGDAASQSFLVVFRTLLYPFVALGWPLAIVLYLYEAAKVKINAKLLGSLFVLIAILMGPLQIINYLLGIDIVASAFTNCDICETIFVIFGISVMIYIYWAVAKVLTEADHDARGLSKRKLITFLQFYFLPLFVFYLSKRVKRCSSQLDEV